MTTYLTGEAYRIDLIENIKMSTAGKPLNQSNPCR